MSERPQNKYLKPFKKGQSGNPNGTPRKTISAVNLELEQQGYTVATINDIKDCYLRLINIEIPELTELVKNDKQPALVQIVGKAILSGKGFDVIEKMLDRSIGKAMQQMEHSGELNIQQLPPIIIKTNE